MRIMFRHVVLLAGLASAACARGASPPATQDSAAAACPDTVKQSVAARFADASTTSCKAERQDGRDQFEVKLTSKGGDRFEVDVAPDGTILQTEVAIALNAVPPAVLAAFAAKYPNARPTRAEKQTRPGKTATYEVAFTGVDKKTEATFAEDGSFIDEE